MVTAVNHTRGPVRDGRARTTGADAAACHDYGGRLGPALLRLTAQYPLESRASRPRAQFRRREAGAARVSLTVGIWNAVTRYGVSCRDRRRSDHERWVPAYSGLGQ